ncbi:Transcription factor [Microbotryomycetes sp. JL221]|nr:Transcription factor [Microbotryomycetes sp. JL221]
MEVDSSKRDDPQAIGRHVRASSDPGSRGGAFGSDGFGLDSEPNPFESSFSNGKEPQQPTKPQSTSAHHPLAQQNSNQVPGQGPLSASRRARSISPNSLARATPGGSNKISGGMSFGTDLQNYNWGAFDPMMRTGLTPMMPGGAPPPGGGVSFPPPSPATAALFAMMTNNTPGDPTTMAGGGGGDGHRPHEGNQFDASFARATVKSEDSNTALYNRRSQQQQPTMSQQAPVSQPSTTMINGAGRPVPAPMRPPGMTPHSGPSPYYGHSHSHPPQIYGHQAPYSQYGVPGASQPPAQAPSIAGAAGRSAPTAAGGGHNPLYLLSQASGHTDDAVVAAAALSGLAAPGFGSPQPGHSSLPANTSIPQNMMPGPSSVGPTLPPTSVSAAVSTGSPASASTPNSQRGAPTPKRSGAASGAGKRKKQEPVTLEDELESPPPPPAKKGRGGGRGARATSDSVKDDASENDGTSPKGSGPLDPDEEKRKNFLERNRQAALKCRQRKKAWLANLQAKVEMLTTDNETLQSTVTNLKEEIQSLRAILSAHANCPVASTALPRTTAAYTNGQHRY